VFINLQLGIALPVRYNRSSESVELTISSSKERYTLRTFLLLGAINGFLSVALGAFAAHGLKQKLDEYLLGVFQTGVTYQATHALALIAVALLIKFFPGSSTLTWAGWCFFFGIVLFSGSLYALSLTNIKVLGAITPFGGVLFLVGWALLAIQAWKTAS
jgi:uncharacterized membrane protein YgdD (TMEM256/DUF423 family)